LILIPSIPCRQQSS